MTASRNKPAFLFDLGGTLVDSVYQHVLAWREALERCGIQLAVWRTGMYATLCVVLHHHRSFPAGCGDEAEVSQLGLGGFRWRSYASARNPALGRVAVVGVLVPGSRRWSLINPAWLVIRDVRDRGSQLSCG